jgi:putative nucleotide binding protein
MYQGRQQEKVKEEIAVVLDFLPYGYPLDNSRNTPIIQAIGKENFILLQLIPRRGEKIEVKEEVYIGEGKRDKIQFIQGRLHREKLTETAKQELEEFIKDAVKEREEQFVKFFNEAQSINTRIHQIELLPSFGKKHTEAILKARDEKSFESFEDIKQRAPNIPDPVKAVEKRIMEELTEIQRYNLFIK